MLSPVWLTHVTIFNHDIISVVSEVCLFCFFEAIPVEKAVCRSRSVFLTTWHCILSAEYKMAILPTGIFVLVTNNLCCYTSQGKIYFFFDQQSW